MAYLKRISYRPNMDDLTVAEKDFVTSNFEMGADLVIVHKRDVVYWRTIEAVEVAKSARIAGPAGWIVKTVLHHNEERYHVGIYYGAEEVVVQNVSLNTAKYIVRMIAYYAPKNVEYTGPDGVAPLEIG